MKESYGEGLASHTDPESCVDSGKAGHEALTGAHAGGVSSREILRNQSADAVCTSGRQRREMRQREYHSNSARSETPACMETPRPRTGRPYQCPTGNSERAGWRR
jgi:RNA-directed DNA polymerase